MDPITYFPRGPRWSPRAAINALYDFKDGPDKSYTALSQLREVVQQIGDVTILNVVHDKNEVPHLTELLYATFIVEHGTGTTFCWCSLSDGLGWLGGQDVRLFDGSLQRMHNTDISRILSKTARQMGLFLWSPCLYTTFPLNLFAPPKSSRREFARYLNGLRYPSLYRPRRGTDVATKSTDVRK